MITFQIVSGEIGHLALQHVVLEESIEVVMRSVNLTASRMRNAAYQFVSLLA